MIETLQTQLSKLFYPINERVGSYMEVSTGFKNKQKYLVFTVTMMKPSTINIYTVKLSNKGELKKILLCDSKSLRKLDCKEFKNQPGYELQLAKENKSWVFISMKLEDKRNFVGTFCRAIASLEPQVFKEIELANLPPDLNISAIGENESLDVLLTPNNDGVKLDCKTTEHDRPSDPNATTPFNDGYRALTAKEEEDITQFLNQLDSKSGLKNVNELTERLQEQLAYVEGTNIHSIMGSEPQVLKLMSTLDETINRTEALEAQLDSYHRFLEEVEDAMSSLQDHDHLVQTTIDNRSKLLSALEAIVQNLTLDPKYFQALQHGDLKDTDSKIQCIEAARSLDQIINVPLQEGEQHLSAVKERMTELNSLKDTFAVKLARQVNDTILMFASQITIALTLNTGNATESSAPSTLTGSVNKLNANSFDVSSDLFMAQRSNLLQLAPLVGSWLQSNNPELLIELKRLYVLKLKNVFKRQVQELFASTQQTIVNLVRPAKGQNNRLIENQSSDFGSVLSLTTPGTSFLTQIESIFEDCLQKTLMIMEREQNFLTQFFGYNPQIVSSRPYNPSIPIQNDDLVTLGDCMNRLFDGIEADVSNLVTTCEHILPMSAMSLLMATSRVADSLENQQQAKEGGDKAGTKIYGSNFIGKVMWIAKHAFERQVGKKSRKVAFALVRSYVDFAECSMAVFTGNVKIADLERAHVDIVLALINNIERIASEAVKTPGEVIQLESYHRLQDILRRLKIGALNEQVKETKNRYNLALNEFTKNCMGRPLEKLASFFENVQAALNAGVRPEVISYQFAFSLNELKKVIREYPGKEVKRGLESLCKKVEKHLSDESNLFPVVWHSIQTQFITQCVRFSQLIEQCYPDTGINLEFTVNDLQKYFQEISHAR